MSIKDFSKFIACYNGNIGTIGQLEECSPVDRGSVPSRVLPKTQKMVLDAIWLNTQHYKIRIKGYMEQSREWYSAFLCTSV